MISSNKIVYNSNYSGFPNGTNWVSSGFDKFTITSQSGQCTPGNMLSNNNMLDWRHTTDVGTINNKWSSFFSNYTTKYIDITLDVQESTTYDARNAIYLIIRGVNWTSDHYYPGTSWPAGEYYELEIDYSNGATYLQIKSKGNIMKSMTLTGSWPAILRVVLDETETFYVYRDNILITSVQFTGTDIVNGVGSWGLIDIGSAGSFDNHTKFNKIKVIGDAANYTLI